MCVCVYTNGPFIMLDLSRTICDKRTVFGIVCNVVQNTDA